MGAFLEILFTPGIAALILLAFLARLVHYALFKRYHMTFTEAPGLSVLYFGAWIILVYLLFPAPLRTLFADISLLGYATLVALFLGVFPGVYRAMRLKLGSPEELAHLFPSQGMLTLEEKYIYAKIGDVVFQQCVAGSIVILLAVAKVPYAHIVFFFIPLFAVAHFYLFRTSGFLWGLHYTAFAMLGGFAFPFLYLFAPHGIIFALVLHMGFYVFSAIFFASLPRNHTT
jgi:hypothetical protein